MDENQNLTGTTNELTTAAALEYEGFTAKNFSQVIIQPDGSSVVKIYYDRNLCEVTLYDGETAYRTMRGRYGAAFPTVNTPIKTGYTFNGWTPSLPSTYTTQTEYHMNWSPRTDIVYKVEHYQQNLDPSTGYTKLTRDNQTLTGTTGTLTQAEANEYEGFTVLEFDQVPIAGDGSTVVKIYYDRN